MKRFYSILSLFIITFMFVGLINVKAESVYKAYKVGEVIEAQIDDSGNKGTFIVIGDSPTTSDEVVVIQKNGGLDAAIKNLKIRYDSNGNFKLDNSDGYMSDLRVTNAQIRSTITFNNAGVGITDVNKFLDLAPDMFNGYMRINQGHVYGIMKTTDYAKLVEQYTQDVVDKIFEHDNYWLDDGAASSDPLQFTDSDTFKINSSANKLEIYTDGKGSASKTYDLPKYARVVDKSVASNALNGAQLLVEYEPAIMFTLCKKDISVPDTPNPPTSDMNIMIMSIVGMLSLGVMTLSTKKILSIK